MAKPIVWVLFIIVTFLFLGPSMAEEDIHDLLPKYDLPRGLLPANVASYTFTPPSSPSSGADGSFSIKLSSPCYVHFAGEVVYYGRDISGRLGYGAVRDARGIQAKKLFVWLSVTGMQVDREGDGSVEFFVGSLSEKLPAKEFEDVPACGSKATTTTTLLRGFSTAPALEFI